MTQTSTVKRLFLSSLSLFAIASSSLAQLNPEVNIQGFSYVGKFGQAGESNHTYFLTPSTGSWVEMEAMARTLGNGHLVAVNSAEENAFVAGIVPTNAYVMANGNPELFWIGLNKNTETNTWGWSTGDAYSLEDRALVTPVYYHNWCSNYNQPDNWHGDQNYGVIHSDIQLDSAPQACWDDAHNSEVNGVEGAVNSFRGIVEVIPCEGVTPAMTVTYDGPKPGTADIYLGYTGYGAQKATFGITGANGLAFEWFGTALTNTNSSTPTFTPTSGGDYKFTVVVTGANGCIAMAEKTVTVVDIRDGNSGNVWICHNGNGQSVSVSGANNHIKGHAGDKLGTCPVTVTATARRREVLNHGGSAEVKVYPNPAQNAFFVEVPHTEEAATVVLLDMQGKVVDTRTVNVNDNHQVRFDLANSARGLYFVEVSYGQERFHSKIVLQ